VGRVAPVPEGMEERLGSVAGEAANALAQLEKDDAVARMWQGDHTLWQDDPTEVADRLGWLHSPAEMADRVEELDAFAAEATNDGLRHAVILGMGGSSLFPEVLAKTFAESRLGLHVLDTTDPAAVLRISEELLLDRTLLIPASKSGTTIETTSALSHFWGRVDDGRRFAAITDAGTPLADLAHERGFRALFENRADIGGRYSALSFFGIVPAALMGAIPAGLLSSAHQMLDGCGAGVPAAANPGARLAAVLAGAARSGRDKLTVLMPPTVSSFGSWLEQLVAESTGKHGTGLLPVVDEPVGPPDVYGKDRVFVSYGTGGELDALASAGHPVVVLPVPEPTALGGEVVRWEIATALLGALLGINPFDQPDVAAAKDATARVLREGLPELPTQPVEVLTGQLRAGDYLALQAYVDPGSPLVDELERVRIVLRDRHRVATTLGLGPRYLHSTGQMHKGGPATGVFLQVVGDDPVDADIPGQSYGFARLKQAQAAGDLEALQSRGLRAGRVELADLLEVTS